jgi:hypothetical protein
MARQAEKEVASLMKLEVAERKVKMRLTTSKP